MKVVLMMGICGACRELINMMVNDIQDKGDLLVIKIPNSKTSIQRIFAITNYSINGVNIIEIYRKYCALRPKHTEHSRFFLNYGKGKCTVQVVGKNTMAKIPYKIAEYLKLSDVRGYTGHSFRRSSASLLVLRRRRRSFKSKTTRRMAIDSGG